MKVKACGITNLNDGLLAAEAGVWAVGFIFVKDTPRYINPEKARKIIESLPNEVEKVGVFMDLAIEEVIEVSNFTKITKIQLHGEESPEYCLKLAQTTGKEIIKSILIKNINDIELINQYKTFVSYILLDTFSEKQKGGTGKTFDWEIAKQAKKYDVPIILAGGLNPDNIETANAQVEPFVLDLSSGIEKTKGIKDEQKLEKLKKIIHTNRANL